MTILLIYPPVAKSCEPPAGIARLAGTLRDHRINCLTVDLNLECLLSQFDLNLNSRDTWSRRAYKKRYKSLRYLRTSRTYQTLDRYKEAVNNLSRVLSLAGRLSNCDISLGNYSDETRSPLSSVDLILAAEHFHKNHFYPFFRKRIDHLIDTCSPTVIGISFSYLSQALTGFAILGYLNHLYPEVTIVVGGGLITSWMSSPQWNSPFTGLANHLISGPGENELLTLMKQEPLQRCGRFDYDDFPLNHYLSPGLILPYAASDGCYWKQCTFCPDRAEKIGYSQVHPTTVTRDLSHLINRYQPMLLHFLDNAISPALQKHLVNQPPGIPWYGFSRFEKELEDLVFCQALRKSGCIMLKLGLESGSQDVLDQMHKGINLERVSQILSHLENAGIATYIYLLFGTPYETEKDALMTMKFIKQHRSAITFLNLAIFNMPVCSPEAAENANRFTDGDLSLYCDFEHPCKWNRKAVRNFLHTRFRRDPHINQIILRDPPVFTSNHAPLFLLNGAASVFSLDDIT